MKKRAWIALYTAAGLLTPVGLTAIAPTTTMAATNPILYYGSRGSAVQQLQRELNALGFKVGAVDGDLAQRHCLGSNASRAAATLPSTALSAHKHGGH